MLGIYDVYVMQTIHGSWTGWAMETALLYSAEVLVQMYACVGAWRYLYRLPAVSGTVFLCQQQLLPPIGTAIVFSYIQQSTNKSKSLPSFLSVLVLAFSADGIHLSLQLLLKRFLRGRMSQVKPPSRSWCYGCLSLLLLIWSIARAMLGATAWIRPIAVLSATSLVLVYAVALALVARLSPSALSESCASWFDQQANFVVWILPLLPFITVGDLVMIQEGLVTWTILKALIPIGIRLVLSYRVIASYPPGGVLYRPSHWCTSLQLLRAVLVVLSCWRLLTMNFQDWTATMNFQDWTASGDCSFHPLSMLLLGASGIDIFEIVFILADPRILHG